MNERALHEVNEEISELAKEVVCRGFGSIILFFLEAHRPLRGLMYHGMTFSQPLFIPFFGAKKMEILLKVLESDSSVESLITAIEAESQVARK